MAQCGFGRAAVNDVWRGKYPFGTDLEGRFLYVRDGEAQWLLAAFDFSYMFRRTSGAWRRRVSEETGIPFENIWEHELQNHSAPTATDLDGEPGEIALVERCLPAIREAMKGAQEAELAYVLPDLGTRFNMNREQYIPGLGMVTVWAGCEFDEQDRPHCEDPAVMLLEDWKPQLPAFEKPIYFDRPADPQGALLVFRTPAGEMLGSLARFAAHADVTGAAVWDWGRGDMAEYRYNWDWPGYLRGRVEQALGGTCVCTCGPCGNLSTKKRTVRGYEAGDRQARRIGAGVADALIEEWEGAAPPWRPLTLGGQAHGILHLPMRASFPRDRREVAEATERAEELTRAHRAAIDAGECPARIKQLIDQMHHWQWAGKMVDQWIGLSDEELARGAFPIEIQALRLGELVLAGLPGESLCETSTWLRAQSMGMRLVALDQINSACIYHAGSVDMDLGGYAATCNPLARHATSLTRERALELIRKVMPR